MTNGEVAQINDNLTRQIFQFWRVLRFDSAVTLSAHARLLRRSLVYETMNANALRDCIVGVWKQPHKGPALQLQSFG